VSAPTINPAALTADTTANRLAELVTHYIDHNQPGHFDRDTWDEMAALATAWRAHTGWDTDVEDFDRNDAGTRCLRAFGLEFDPDASFDPIEVNG
jgi:hypothetical protein